jgi:tetratricopeptide (TPR) repeat protein
LTESSHFKEKGNQAFKLGQFGQAVELYARASQALPSGHALLIVTQNNRAAALLKVGEYRETITECDRSILLVQGPDGQGVNDVLPADVGVNLKDQLGKALMRRAMAHENLEKYKEARDDWAKLRELEPGHRNAAEGHRRCEKAIAVMNGAGDRSSSSTSTKRPGPPPSSSVQSSAARSNGIGSNSSPMQDIMAAHRQSNSEAKLKADLNRSEGVSKLRQTAAQQEREDDERLRLTDQVDRKMVTWKSGKEDNIRALLASLGSVLWEGAAWKPVGMHELVTPAQVKINYMKAIAKMHPDKVRRKTQEDMHLFDSHRGECGYSPFFKYSCCH